MKTLMLVRHAESEANADSNLLFGQDKYDHMICLTEKGREQALACGRNLKTQITGPYTLFISPYLRTQETFEFIERGLGQSPVSKIIDGRLREQEFRKFKDQIQYDEKNARRKARGKLYYRFKNGESGYDVLARVGGFYNQLRMDWYLGNREDVVLIVAHEITIRCLLSIALDLAPADFENLPIKNCQIHTLAALDNLKFRLIN